MIVGLGALVCCAGPLPSETPLGKGPLFAAEEKARAKHAEERDQALANAPDAPSKTKVTVVAKPSGGSKTDAGVASTPAATAASADAASGDAPKPVGKVSHSGMYVGQDSSLFKLSGLPDRSEVDPNAKTRVEDRPGGGVFLIPVDSSNGKDICKLEASVKDKAQNTFEIKRGQRCFEPEQGGMTGTVRSGSARLANGKLVFDVVLALEISAEGAQISGSLDYHFDGTRQ